ncbi:MAG TPA: MFS transporter [Syntrophales bacterium]|nr:MFS transporter [Syntrophales bacterium]
MSQNSGSGTPLAAYRPGGASAYIILVLLCLTYAFDYTDRMIVASLIPFIKQEWGLSDTLLGSLTGVVSLFIAVFVLPFSLMVDRWSRRKMISIMVFSWSIATILCAFARNYNELLIARAFTGIGEAGYAPAAVAMIAASFPQAKRAVAVGVWDAFAPIGAAVGFLVGGYVGLHYGWQHAFGLVGIPGLLLAIGYWFTRDYKTVPLEGPLAAGAPKSGGLGISVKGLLRIPTIWFVYLAFAMNIAVTTPIMTWFPSYLNRFHGMNEQQAGNMTAMLAMLLLVGAPLGGYLADLWMKRRTNARMVFSAVTSLLSALLLAAAFLMPQSGLFRWFMIGFGILSVAFLAPAAAVIQDVVHPGLRALAYGLCVVCQHVFGAAWSPMLIGNISDHVGLEKALLVLPVFGFVAAALFMAGARYYERDLDQVRHVELVSES